MKRRLIIRPEAEADLSDAALWYETRQNGLEKQFLTDVRDAIDRAAANPFHYRRLRRRPEVRRVLLRRFPYRAFFIVRGDAIIVFRVLHGARHAREWKQAAHE